MNQQDALTFTQAVARAQAGEKEAAYIQLKALLKTNDNHRDPNILLWFAFTSPNLEESETAINMAASIDPNNAGLASARDWLVREQRNQQQRNATAAVSPAPAVAVPLPAWSAPPPTVEVLSPILSQVSASSEVLADASRSFPISTTQPRSRGLLPLNRTGIVIGTTSLLLVAFLIVAGILLFGSNPTDALRKRLDGWNSALQSLTLPPQNSTNLETFRYADQSIKILESFIEPSAARSEWAKQFYLEWVDPTSNYKFLRSSVDGIDLAPDGKSAVVHYSDVYRYKDGTSKVIVENTNWKIVDGVWYRAIKASDIQTA